MKLHTCTPRLAALILLACLPLAVPATDLKLATVAPEGSSWMKDLRTAGLQIKERTGGRVNIKFYGGGIQGTDKKVLRKIRIGQLQGGSLSAHSFERAAAGHMEPPDRPGSVRATPVSGPASGPGSFSR